MSFIQADYYAHPEQYKPVFHEKIAPYASVIGQWWSDISCSFSNNFFSGNYFSIQFYVFAVCSAYTWHILANCNFHFLAWACICFPKWIKALNAWHSYASNCISYHLTVLILFLILTFLCNFVLMQVTASAILRNCVFDNFPCFSVNCMYWERRFPRLLTIKQIQDLMRNGCPLVGICDITCDVEGSIEFINQTTLIDSPFFRYF